MGFNMKPCRYTTIVSAVCLIIAVAACTDNSHSPQLTPAPPTLRFSTPPAATLSVGAFAITNVEVTDPGATISEFGQLPDGVSFHRTVGGYAVLEGIPKDGSGGQYSIDLTATDNRRHAAQLFTLTVDEKPQFPTLDVARFGANTYHGNQFLVIAIGYPTPTISISSGTLPSGFTFTSYADGSATIEGSPGTFETPCNSQVTLRAVNSSGIASYTVMVDIGDYLCWCNVVCTWLASQAISLGKWIYNKWGKPVGRWIVQQGKKAWQFIKCRSGRCLEDPEGDPILIPDALTSIVQDS
jgi:hypothetical protein